MTIIFQKLVNCKAYRYAIITKYMRTANLMSIVWPLVADDTNSQVSRCAHMWKCWSTIRSRQKIGGQRTLQTTEIYKWQKKEEKFLKWERDMEKKKKKRWSNVIIQLFGLMVSLINMFTAAFVVSSNILKWSIIIISWITWIMKNKLGFSSPFSDLDYLMLESHEG